MNNKKELPQVDLRLCGGYIRKLRETKGITIRELSDAVGICYSAIPNFEKGKPSVSATNAQKIYDYVLSLPNAKTPLVTARGRRSTVKRKKRSSVAKQIAEKPKQTTSTQTEKPKQTADTPAAEEPRVPISKRIHDMETLLSVTQKVVFCECRHLIDEIYDPQTTAVIRTADAKMLTELINFLIATNAQVFIS